MVVEGGLLGFRVLVHWKSHQITCDRNAHFYKYLVEISLSNISNLITMTLWRSMSILLSVTFEFDKRKMKPFFAFLWFQSSWERILMKSLPTLYWESLKYFTQSRMKWNWFSFAGPDVYTYTPTCHQRKLKCHPF